LIFLLASASIFASYIKMASEQKLTMGYGPVKEAGNICIDSGMKIQMADEAAQQQLEKRKRKRKKQRIESEVQGQ
jgi:hypothetical protein